MTHDELRTLVETALAPHDDPTTNPPPSPYEWPILYRVTYSETGAIEKIGAEPAAFIFERIDRGERVVLPDEPPPADLRENYRVDDSGADPVIVPK